MQCTKASKINKENVPENLVQAVSEIVKIGDIRWGTTNTSNGADDAETQILTALAAKLKHEGYLPSEP